MPDQYVDLNDLSLEIESLEGFDPLVDAHALPAPVSDGIHRVKLSFVRPSNRLWKPTYVDGTQRVKHLSTKLRADVLDEAGAGVVFDGRMGTWITRDGGCPVADVIRAIIHRSTEARTQQSLAQELEDLIQGAPIVRVRTIWEASCPECKDTSNKGKLYSHVVLLGDRQRYKARGQKNFPLLRKGADGQPEVRQHNVDCDICGQIVAAQAVIISYLPDDTVAATRAPGISGADEEAIPF